MTSSKLVKKEVENLTNFKSETEKAVDQGRLARTHVANLLTSFIKEEDFKSIGELATKIQEKLTNLKRFEIKNPALVVAVKFIKDNGCAYVSAICDILDKGTERRSVDVPIKRGFERGLFELIEKNRLATRYSEIEPAIQAIKHTILTGGSTGNWHVNKTKLFTLTKEADEIFSLFPPFGELATKIQEKLANWKAKIDASKRLLEEEAIWKAVEAQIQATWKKKGSISSKDLGMPLEVARAHLKRYVETHQEVRTLGSGYDQLITNTG